MSKKRLSPYTYPLTGRRAMAEYICSIGGYSADWGREQSAIEFNVAADRTDFDFDHLWEKYAKDYMPAGVAEDPEKFKAYYDLCRELHKDNEQYLWEWGQEDAVRNVMDGDAYRMLASSEKPFKVEMGLYGRSGKHLCISEFEGHDLKLSPDRLYEDMMEQTLPNGDLVTGRPRLAHGAEWTGGWDYEDIRNLYMMCRQWEVDFTPAKASAEVEYNGAFSFFANIVDSEWTEREQEIADHDDLVEHARTVMGMLVDTEDFLVVCRAAGVSEAELM